MIREIEFFSSERKRNMYKLIVDGVDESANGTFNKFEDALWWYNYSVRNGASSVALWCDLVLIKFFIKEQK
jgi:hypothetical protein